jgi:hypothetical protein
LLFSIVFLTNLSYAQNNSSACGFVPSAAELTQYQAVMTQLRNNPQQNLTNAPVSASIPIYFWVNSPGTSFLPSAIDLEQMVAEVNTYFNFPNDTHFTFCGVSYPNDSRWYTMNANERFTNTQVFNTYDKANVINVYMAQYPLSFAGQTLGTKIIYSTNTAGAYNSTTGVRTLAHELGHTFGLLHTFNDFGRPKELVTRVAVQGRIPPNFLTAADMMESTPAQPYDCNIICSASSCNLVDDNGDTYDYSTTNLMSSTYRCSNSTAMFNQEQQDKMNFAIMNTHTILINAPCSEAIAGVGLLKRFRFIPSDPMSTECFGNDEAILAKNATVNIQNTSTGASLCSLTPDVNGYFQSCNFPKNSSLTITPSKNSNYKEGVDETDISLIARHILGEEFFIYPFQLLAADVDNSGEIDGLDMVHIRRLIKNYTSTFPNNVGSWRFVPKYFLDQPSFMSTFSGDPFAATFGGYSYNGNNSYMDKITLDMSVPSNQKIDAWTLLPYKVGDVNYCETTYGVKGPNNPPSGPAVSLGVARVANTQYRMSTPRTMSMRRVEEKTIVLKAKTAANVAALQIGINFLKDKFTIKEIEKGDFGSENDAFDFNKEDKGKLRVLWSNKNGNAKNIRVGTVILKAKVKANTNIDDLLTVLNLDNQVLKTKFYDENGNLVPMDLEWDDDDNAGQNTALVVNAFPNPFRNEVSLEINSPVAGTATITLSNIITRQNIVMTQQLLRGANVVNINNTASLSPGMLTYSIVVGGKIANGTITKTR